jgi:hypothetical protein
MVQRGLLWLAAVCGALATLLLSTLAVNPAAFADHTTRVNDLQRAGADMWLIAATLAAAALLLAAFAAAILLWERRDTTEDETRP